MKEFWWLVWQNEGNEEIEAFLFPTEPGNDEILECFSDGWNMVGYPVQADTEQEAIEKVLASDD